MRTRLATLTTLTILLFTAGRAEAQLAVHSRVNGTEITSAEIKGKEGPFKPVAWDDLSTLTLEPGLYQLRVKFTRASGIDAIEIPHCAGRGWVSLDARRVTSALGTTIIPVITDGPHEVTVDLNVSAYEHRVACGEPPRVGTTTTTREGLGVLSFASPHTAKGGGQAVVFVPPGHDVKKPGVLLVGTHPWNGSIWTYAAYKELLREARAKDVVLLMPAALGNSLYIEDAEDEVMRAIEAVKKEVAVDPRAISIWGASMGGQGATTIAFHHPDKFASVTSYFGDSRLDVTAYVRGLLPNDPTAKTLNALDVIENGRYLPVWLIHGEIDRISNIKQSVWLDEAMRARSFHVRFDRVAQMGHEGALVVRFVSGVVQLASTARVPAAVPRVTFKSVRPIDTSAYGARIVRASAAADAFVDVERRGDTIHVRNAGAVKTIFISPGAFGLRADERPPIVIDDSTLAVEAKWEGT